MFTASKLQIATYLLGVCPFSIAFLVFLNSSASFVITDLIGVVEGVGDAVGNLGFADELLALVACPLWGVLSDRIGVRTVCVMAYTIIAVALIVFVQAKNVYPELLLGRLFFSIGGAAASTMVTAVLPAMSYITKTSPAEESNPSEATRPSNILEGGRHAPALSISSELTITPARFQAQSFKPPSMIPDQSSSTELLRSSSSKLAGLVGTCAGCGALTALLLFLPLPARFQKHEISPPRALQYSYYVVAAVASVIALACFIGLRRLPGESGKSWRRLLLKRTSSQPENNNSKSIVPSRNKFWIAFKLGFEDSDIGLGYVGGFVARASSVGISLFIPLLINASFISSGLCSTKDSDTPSGLPDIKRQCPQAYILAAEMTGVSQLVALICAPAFGYASAKFGIVPPLLFGSVAGILGYPMFATQFSPKGHKPIAFLSVCLIGISQIGAIVCSLASLSGGVLSHSNQNDESKQGPSDARILTEEASPNLAETRNESTALLTNTNAEIKLDLSEMKGSIAGLYSLYGGAGILLLTKLGGFLFDNSSRGAPFYIMTSFNAVLLVVCVFIGMRRWVVAGQTV